eukprot:gene2457-4770_t
MAYYDLNLRSRSSRDKDRQLIVKRAIELGYSCVAWTNDAFGKITGSTQAQFKASHAVSLDQIQLKDALQLRLYVDSQSNSSNFTSLRQLSRLTLTVDDMSDAQSITISAANDILKNYDIIAVCPGNQQILSHLCKESDVDIICFDFSHRSTFSLNKKLILQLEGKLLRIPRFCGADTLNMMRGPLDVLNIARVLGIDQQKAMKCVSENCVTLLKHAAARKIRFLPVELTSQDDFLKRWPEISINILTSSETRSTTTTTTRTLAALDTTLDTEQQFIAVDGDNEDNEGDLVVEEEEAEEDIVNQGDVSCVVDMTNETDDTAFNAMNRSNSSNDNNRNQKEEEQGDLNEEVVMNEKNNNIESEDRRIMASSKSVNIDDVFYSDFIRIDTSTSSAIVEERVDNVLSLSQQKKRKKSLVSYEEKVEEFPLLTYYGLALQEVGD